MRGRSRAPDGTGRSPARVMAPHPARADHYASSVSNRGSRSLTARSTRPPPQQADQARTGVRSNEAGEGYARVFWTAFRRSANAMFLVDLDRLIVAVNEAGATLAGRSADALAGERITTLLDDPAEAPDDDVWRAQVLRGESFGRRRLQPTGGAIRVPAFGPRGS